MPLYSSLYTLSKQPIHLRPFHSGAHISSVMPPQMSALQLAYYPRDRVRRSIRRRSAEMSAMRVSCPRHVRVSVPTIPASILAASNAAATKILPAEAAERVATFLAPGDVTVITGAGISVDSGIRAYRGHDGRVRAYLRRILLCLTMYAVHESELQAHILPRIGRPEPGWTSIQVLCSLPLWE